MKKTMERKVLTIGIDSLDPDIIIDNLDCLPNFKRLFEEGKLSKIQSVFPPDTIPAWVSIFSGKSPDEHGLLYSYDLYDYENKGLKEVKEKICVGYEPIWDLLNKKGFSTAVIFPNLVFPSQDVDGVMVAKCPFEKRIDDISSTIKLDVKWGKNFNPITLPNEFRVVWGGHPGDQKIYEWIELAEQQLIQEFEIVKQLYNSNNYDFFFAYYSTLDIIQHRLWRYFDSEDLTYTYDSKLSNAILDFYKLFDSHIGHFMKVHNGEIIVISDHGHKRRPTKVVNINEHLRLNQLLTIEKENELKMKFYQIIKNVYSTFNNLIPIEQIAAKLITSNKNLNSLSKEIILTSDKIDKINSICCLSNFAGIKTYSYGGINVFNKSHIEEIIIVLKKLKNEDGSDPFNFIQVSSEVFKGKYSQIIYPEIIFELDSNLGVGWDMYCPIFSNSKDHQVASGGHSEFGVLIVDNFPLDLFNKSITDYYSIICQIFNINKPTIKN